MHDFSTGRSGFDRVLAAVAATFLLTGTATLAHADPAKPADAAAISAAVPTPDTSNVPPPTAADLKSEAAKTAAEPAKADAKTGNNAAAADAPKTGAATPAEAAKTEPAKADTATTAPAAPARPDDVKTDNAKTETPAAAPAVAALDPSAEALRSLVTAKASKYFDRKKEREAVEAFYKDRNYAPLWTKGAAATARANDAIARLKKADEDGLDADDYPVPNFAAAATPDAQADAELKLTESVLDYARHAQSGRMHWSQVSGDIQYPEHSPDPAEVLINVSTARNAGAALETYNPPHKLYKELKAKLAELRGKTEEAAKIADGETLRFVKPTKKNPNPAMMDDARVPALRAKLGVTENASDTHYDATVAAAVRKFQSANDLKATGVLDNHTVAALNGPRNDRKIDIVRVNMERWRWLPRDLGAAALGDAYVILNIPDYSLQLMHNGATAWKTRVVVGKPGKHATPLLTETMKYITVNPTWNVPPSIIYNEYLPALQQDPTVLERMGLKLQRNPDGTIRISQPPGEANALGRIRFNFPNKFLVYQHDTPDKYLFAKSERAFSHGCMRVQNPDQYAATILSIALPKDHYTPEKIRSMYGHNEININLPTPLPVNITYQTAFVDDAGKLEFRKDIYGRDATMIKLLKEGGRRNLETVVAHSQPNYVRPTGNINIPGDGYADRSSAPNFFQMLFGGGGRAEAEPEPRSRRRSYR
ncbi:L,D-transpeptidase family protein [[Pseudomonas] carboxydohydrogena]|uniref:L,D-transpeptidase family protein n=1 Tax=Afipia carboxydohydrogena TaxID=290 RepID=A0ABY8BTZ9_AFICR|nr:L,D-transpeptidase family protein [[Pseudomonas] carboxydohydrogena]WEF52349.1 L,D-transpeptidase family protein [[Pseudomonas] carboxydohydrogena]